MVFPSFSEVNLYLPEIKTEKTKPPCWAHYVVLQRRTLINIFRNENASSNCAKAFKENLITSRTAI